jgi:hypothetical protein
MVSHLLTLGFPSTKDQTNSEKNALFFSYSRKAFALVTTALIFSLFRTIPLLVSSLLIFVLLYLTILSGSKLLNAL